MNNCTVKAYPLPVARQYMTKWIISLGGERGGTPRNEKELSMLSLTELYRVYQDELGSVRAG